MKLYSYFAVAVALIVSVARAQSAEDSNDGFVMANLPDCVYNSTHCACSPSSQQGSGTCLRHNAGPLNNAKCSVDSCNTHGSFVCDCFGTNMCSLENCGAWKLLDAEATVPPMGSTSVSCHFAEGNKCTTKLQETEYKMVQFGSSKDPETMFNMTWQKDTGNAITESFKMGSGRSMHDRWPDFKSLIKRQINMRLYERDVSTDSAPAGAQAPQMGKFVCAVFNNWGGDNDGLGNYKVKSTIKSLSGEKLSWLQCDDWSGARNRGECKTPYSGTSLTASHHGLVTHSDGWCVGPLRYNGNAISIAFESVQNFEGINFLGSDSEATEFLFADPETGMSGPVDATGLVQQDGTVPEIIIKPYGIPTM